MMFDIYLLKKGLSCSGSLSL